MCSEEPDQIWICSFCIGEPYLRDRIKEAGTEKSCHYCGEINTSLTLEKITDLTEQALENHFIRTSTEPSDMEYTMINHCGHEWFREGDDIFYVIENLLQSEPAVAHDIQALLESKYDDFDSAVMGLETEYESDSYYIERKSEDTGHLDDMWEKFVSSLKTESRYINHSVKETLDSIFDGIGLMRGRQDQAVILEAGPGSAVESLFRARCSTGQTALEQMLLFPDLEIGPPPHRLSASNRMSAKGISVFYGAGSVETAISEVRPPIGCSVVSALFDIIRPLRLLNLPALDSLWESGSMFDPDLIKKLAQVAFLRKLTSRIVIPVLPGEEDFEYIPTQVIAEYLADDPQLRLDGMLYPSVQQSGKSSPENYNVVLFHKASRVDYQLLPDKKNCLIRYGHLSGEDEWEPDICVTQYEDTREQLTPLNPYEKDLPQQDNREPALQIDMTFVSVHDIRAARFEYSSEPVRRQISMPRISVADQPVQNKPQHDDGTEWLDTLL